MESLAQRIAGAQERTLFASEIPHDGVPKNQSEAYAMQYEILRRKCSEIGGWKVGAQSHEAPARGSLIPVANMFRSGVKLDRSKYAQSGLELELYFQFKSDFPASDTPYDDDAILAEVAWFGVAIEVVSSRFVEWPNIDRHLQLADLQNNGALILGERIPYESAYPFLQPHAKFHFGKRNIVQAAPANPAGDPRRLLPWVVNHCVSNGRAFSADMVVTTGTYTGMHFPLGAGIANGSFEDIPEVVFHLE